MKIVFNVYLLTLSTSIIIVDFLFSGSHWAIIDGITDNCQWVWINKVLNLAQPDNIEFEFNHIRSSLQVQVLLIPAHIGSGFGS